MLKFKTPKTLSRWGLTKKYEALIFRPCQGASFDISILTGSGLPVNRKTGFTGVGCKFTDVHYWKKANFTLKFRRLKKIKVWNPHFLRPKIIILWFYANWAPRIIIAITKKAVFIYEIFFRRCLTFFKIANFRPPSQLLS